MARAIGAEGLTLYNAQRWEEAYKLFQEADKLYHAPTLVLFMARCQQAQGKLVEAAAIYETLLAEPLPDGASKAFIEAHESAKVELATVRRRTPKVMVVLVHLEGTPAASSVGVMLDGASVKMGEIAVNPGAHTLRATAENAEPIERSFTIAEASTQNIRLAFRMRSPAIAPLPPIESAEEAGEEPSKGSLIPAIAAFSVGALGLSVGAITGAVSMSQVNDLESRCTGNLCSPDAQPEADSAGMLGNVSTASFIVGGVGVAAGVVLLFVRPGGTPSVGTSARAVPPASGVTWSAGLGLGRIDIRGSF
ncbi:MAG: tetratricopeptide repeat protein [Polyangiaceae bacterium]|nr:tetratricopeptide repeat protein [Polyangiaceae bacterium]